MGRPSEGVFSHGKSQAMKLTAAMAMPTPKSTPARTRFDPPSPKAKVRPETTMATSESPRAMVLVNACCRTFTAFSHGEAPAAWANAGAASRSATTDAAKMRTERNQPRKGKARFLMIHLTKELARTSEGKFNGLCPPHVTAGTHWSKDTLGVPLL